MNIWPMYVLSLCGVPVHVLTPYVHIHIFSRSTNCDQQDKFSPSLQFPLLPYTGLKSTLIFFFPNLKHFNIFSYQQKFLGGQKPENTKE